MSDKRKDREEFIRNVILNGIEKGLRNKEIALNLNISMTTLSYWMKKLDITNTKFKYKTPLNGDMFYRWMFLEEVVKQREDTGYNEIYWKCECQCEDKTIKLIRYDHLIANKRGYRSESCGCLRRERASESNWRGHEEISGHYFNSLYNGALMRGIEFEIDIKYIWNLFLRQNKKCALSGEVLIFAKRGSVWKTSQTASLDRINNNQGYTKSNVQWIHKDINFMKQDFTEELFFKYIKNIYEYRIKNEIS